MHESHVHKDNSIWYKQMVASDRSRSWVSMMLYSWIVMGPTDMIVWNYSSWSNWSIPFKSKTSESESWGSGQPFSRARNRSFARNLQQYCKPWVSSLWLSDCSCCWLLRARAHHGRSMMLKKLLQAMANSLWKSTRVRFLPPPMLRMFALLLTGTLLIVAATAAALGPKPASSPS